MTAVEQPTREELEAQLAQERAKLAKAEAEVMRLRTGISRLISQLQPKLYATD